MQMSREMSITHTLRVIPNFSAHANWRRLKINPSAGMVLLQHTYSTSVLIIGF